MSQRGGLEQLVVETARRLLNTVPGITMALGIAGAIGGLVSLTMNFLWFAAFGGLTGRP